MRSSDCATDRPRYSWRMEHQTAWLVLPRCNPQSALGFDPFYEGRQYVFPSSIETLAKRQNRWQGGRYRVSRRIPHRFVIEHMHRCSVQRRRANRGSREAEIQCGCLLGTTEAANVLSDYSRSGLAAAGHRYG